MFRGQQRLWNSESQESQGRWKFIWNWKDYIFHPTVIPASQEFSFEGFTAPRYFSSYFPYRIVTVEHKQTAEFRKAKYGAVGEHWLPQKNISLSSSTTEASILNVWFWRGASKGWVWQSSRLLLCWWLEEECRFVLKEKFHFSHPFSQVWVWTIRIWESKCQHSSRSEEKGYHGEASSFAALGKGTPMICSALMPGHQGVDKLGQLAETMRWNCSFPSDKRELVLNLLLRLWWIWICFPLSSSYRDRFVGLGFTFCVKWLNWVDKT